MGGKPLPCLTDITTFLCSLADMEEGLLLSYVYVFHSFPLNYTRYVLSTLPYAVLRDVTLTLE